MNDNRPKGTKKNGIMDMITKERRFGQIENDTLIRPTDLVLWTAIGDRC